MAANDWPILVDSLVAETAALMADQGSGTGGGVSDPGISYTGTLTDPFLWTVYPTAGIYRNSVFTNNGLRMVAYNGADQPDLLTLSITGATGLTESFGFTCENLTSFEWPSLVFLDINAQLTVTLPEATTFTLSGLATISAGAEFLPVIDSVTNFALPALVYIGGYTQVQPHVGNGLATASFPSLTIMDDNASITLEPNVDPTLDLNFIGDFSALDTLNTSATIIVTMTNYSNIEVDFSALQILTTECEITVQVTDNAPGTIDFSALTTIGVNSVLTITQNNTDSMSLPLLAEIQNGAVLDLDSASATSLLLPDLALLDDAATLAPTLPALTTLDLSSLTTIGNSASFALDTPALTTLDLSGLVTCGSNIDLTNMSGLTVVTLNPTMTSMTGSFSATGAALDQASVDGILIAIAHANPTNIVIDLSGGTSAAPSSASQAARTALTGAGVTVTTN